MRHSIRRTRHSAERTLGHWPANQLWRSTLRTLSVMRFTTLWFTWKVAGSRLDSTVCIWTYIRLLLEWFIIDHAEKRCTQDGGNEVMTQKEITLAWLCWKIKTKIGQKWIGLNILHKICIVILSEDWYNIMHKIEIFFHGSQFGFG